MTLDGAGLSKASTLYLNQMHPVGIVEFVEFWAVRTFLEFCGGQEEEAGWREVSIMRGCVSRVTRQKDTGGHCSKIG